MCGTVPRETCMHSWVWRHFRSHRMHNRKCMQRRRAEKCKEPWQQVAEEATICNYVRSETKTRWYGEKGDYQEGNPLSIPTPVCRQMVVVKQKEQLLTFPHLVRSRQRAPEKAISYKDAGRNCSTSQRSNKINDLEPQQGTPVPLGVRKYYKIPRGG